METIDRLNKKYGSGTVRYAQEGFKKDWRMQRNNVTSAYTTNWEELPEAG
ncbi:MAG: DUF4113 domain-containing protein [Cyclobacteriaceae bacterium]|nr:DUF4113 domain-containing protein [Cyclobacteriaceae bacterium]